MSTLIRQLFFDIIFVSENVTLLAIALNSNIQELQEHGLTFVVVLLGFSLVGLILICVYYRYLHTWAWLIMVTPSLYSGDPKSEKQIHRNNKQVSS